MMLLEIRQAMPPRLIAKLIAGAVIVFILIIAASSSTYVVEPGHRGVQVTLGKVSPVFKPEGFGLKMPFVTAVISQPIRQQTATVDEECYSSDLQQITIGLKVLYRIPEASVVALFRDYEGLGEWLPRGDAHRSVVRLCRCVNQKVQPCLAAMRPECLAGISVESVAGLVREVCPKKG